MARNAGRYASGRLRELQKPTGTLQVDVDDLWVYYESIGLATPAGAQPVAFTQGIPRLLDLFERYGARATFFVCGRDLPAEADVVAEIVRRGHEVANHSGSHRNGYAGLNRDELSADVRLAHDRIKAATGCAPVGFKAPGFSYNQHLPQVLTALGYLYDSSLLPTYYAPLLRLLQRRLSGGHVDSTHYGRPAYGLAPLRPYELDPARPHRRLAAQAADPRRRLLEAPVTTMPFVRVPMHSTFVLSAGRWLFDLGLRIARLRGVPVNYLLHAADVVDPAPASGAPSDRPDPSLASYRFLAQTWAQKRPLYEHILGRLSAAYRLVPTKELLCSL